MGPTANDITFKRKMPRRRFLRSMGCLCDGKYYVGVGVEIGEGGISIALPHELAIGQDVVVNFQIPDGSFVCVRAELRNVQKAKKPGWYAMGCLFKNLKFEHRREIRSYVSARSESEQ